jgi:hypothetical protein
MRRNVRRGRHELCRGRNLSLVLAGPEGHWTALPSRARSVVGEHPSGLNDTGTDAGPVLNSALAGSAPPQADGIVR